jgi:hypothetical protein
MTLTLSWRNFAVERCSVCINVLCKAHSHLAGDRGVSQWPADLHGGGLRYRLCGGLSRQNGRAGHTGGGDNSCCRRGRNPCRTARVTSLWLADLHCDVTIQRLTLVAYLHCHLITYTGMAAGLGGECCSGPGRQSPRGGKVSNLNKTFFPEHERL